MDPSYWQNKWQIQDIGFNQTKPNPLLQRYIDRLQLQQNARIFVPLCGKTIDMIWLAQQGYEVIGVELSDIACDAFFTEHHIEPQITQIDQFTVYQHPSARITLLSGDFFKLTKEILGPFDAVYDRAALIALPPKLRPQYVQHLTELLAPNTAILLITLAYPQDTFSGPPFSVEEMEVEALFGGKLAITKLYHQEISKMPTHLQNKGLTTSIEEVFCLKYQKQRTTESTDE